MALFGKLTKFQILDILAKFEEKLPNMGTKMFEPSGNFNPHDILSINVEARRMVHFLGLTDYMPEIHYENLPKSVAANVSMENSTVLKKIDINVDYSTLYNNAHALRVLAHEVCHKYLQIYGLYTGFVEFEDEARAELCTIYSGFGIVTLNGYKEEAGYVNLDDFCLAFSLVYKTRGMSDNDIIGITPQQCRPNMSQALSNENISIKQAVLTSQKGDSRFRRNIKLLEFVLKNIKGIKERHDGQGKTLRNSIYRDNEEKYPFYILMKPELILNNSMENKDIDECNRQMENLLGKLMPHLSTNIEELNKVTTAEIICPCCGYTIKKEIPAEAIVKRCPKCKHYFAWDATPWIPELKDPQNKCTDLDNGAEDEEIHSSSCNNGNEAPQSLWGKIIKAFGKK